MPCDSVMYSACSVSRDGSEWRLAVETIHEDSDTYKSTTSSLTSEVGVVTRSVLWLAAKSDPKPTHAVILSNSMNLLQKVTSVDGCFDWQAAE